MKRNKLDNNIFLQRKNSILSKQDKSSVGEWDDKIKKLCDKINSKENLYTTSSCSGRIIIMFDKEDKENGLFINVWHDKLKFDQLKKAIIKIPEAENVKFKSEPAIVHIACKNIEDALELLKISKNAGWKRASIISLGNNIVVEIAGTEKIEFPLIDNGKILVDDEFLKIVLEKANEKLMKGWKNIDKLVKLM